MRGNSTAIFAVLFCFLITVFGQNLNPKSSNYFFAWAGNADRKESDFLAVIDAKPNSKRNGRGALANRHRLYFGYQAAIISRAAF